MKRIISIVLLSFLFAVSNQSMAQSVSNYTFTSAAGTYTAINGINSTAVGDDGAQSAILIGFNFIFGGVNATHVGITTNGMINLGYSNELIGAAFNNALQTSAPLSPLIAAFWDDNNRGTGKISYLTSGTVGSRVFTVQWDSVNIGGAGATSATLTASFQLKLFEGTNVVKLIYSNNFSLAGTATGSIGLNDATSFLSVTPGTTATASSTTANNAIADVTNVKGKEYTFTPPTPTCAPTTLLTVSNITTTGALLSANAVSGATGYQFSVTTVVPPASGTATSLTTYTSTGLTANTQYYAHVRTACSGGTFSAWYTVPFKTKQVYTVPYFQNFDTAVAPALPVNTSIQDLNAGGSWFTSTASGIASPYSVPNCLVYKSDNNIPANDWFYTPAISLTAGTSYRVSYYYKNMSSTSAEKLEVKYGTKDSAAFMTNLIYKDTNIINTTYKVVKQSFTPGTTGNYYFGFHDFSDANQIALNIDDIRIEAASTCDMPTLLNVSFTSASAGTVTWAPATGTFTGYSCTIRDSAMNYLMSSVNTLTSPSFSFSGLFPNQRYYANVYTVCPTSPTSSVTQIMPFTMPAPVCTALPVPYTENFDSAIVVPALKYCYTSQDLNGGTTWVSEWNSGGLHSSPNVMTYKYDTIPGNDWFFTPSIHLLGGTSYKISYKYAAGTDTKKEKLEVKYGLVNNAAAMTNLLVSDTNILYTFFSTKTKTFNPPATGDYYFGFHDISDAKMFYLYVDDISIDFTTDCGAPTGLSANFNTQTSGTVNWGHTTAGTVSNYQYVVTTNPIHPDSGTVTASTSAPFSGLQLSTLYYLHVKSLCTSGSYSAWTTYSFYTPCGAVNIPYSENFDAATIPAMPNCWTKFDNNGGSSWQTDTTGPRSATKALVYHANASLPGDDWAFTPGINFTPGVAYTLSFYYKGKSITKSEKLELRYGNAPNKDSMIGILNNYPSINNTSYNYSYINFIIPEGGVKYIGFHVTSAANQTDLNIDDINLDYMQGCWAPRNLTITMTSATEATASWQAPLNSPTATGYEFSLSDYNATPPSSGFATQLLSSNLVGLLQGVKYYFLVRTVCSGGSFSAWTVDSLYIPCSARDVPYTENFDGVLSPVLPRCVITEDLNGGTTWRNKTINPRSTPNCMMYNYSITTPGNDWFYLAPLNLTAGTRYRLNFYYRAQFSNFFTEKLEVKYGLGNNAAAMTNFIVADTNINFATYRLSESEFTPSATGVYYIGFHSLSSANKYYLFVDDISIDVAPNCGKPTNLAFTPTSNTGGIATWDSTTTGSVFLYQYEVSGSDSMPTNGNFTTLTHQTFTGLIPEQQYYLHVKTICTDGGGTGSLWSVIPFTIPCSPYPIPYYQNFDSLFPPNLPPCITVQNVNGTLEGPNGGNTWGTAEGYSNSPYVSMYYPTNPDFDADDWFYTPQFNFTAGVSYRLGFYYKASDAALAERLEVKCGLGNNAAAMTNLIMKDTNINFTTYRYYQTDFVATSTGTYNIGFHAISLKNKGMLFVDDVKLDFSPSCSEPVNLVVHLIGGNGGTITWSPSTPGIPTGYEYLINTTSANPIGAGISTPNNLIILSGLSMYTQYYVHVRTICTNGNSIWVTAAFYTLPNDAPCNATNLILNGPKSCGNSSMATVSHDPVLPSGCNAPNFTLWYKFTSPVSGRILLKTTIPANSATPLYGSVGWFTLSGACTDSAAYTLVPGSVCTTFGQTGSGDIDSLQSPILTSGTTYYIMISGMDYNFGDFCLNMISIPGSEHIYRFIGNGSWSDINNWENQLIPPAYLPGGDLIIIDNAPGGQCVLDVTQYISTTGSIIVNTGKKLVVPGYLKIQ